MTTLPDCSIHGGRPKELFYCRCPEDASESPAGVHALVIGIGDYMEPADSRTVKQFAQLPGTAPAATHFARFLLNDFRHPDGIPLRTVRVLLSPTDMSGDDEQRYLLTDDRFCQEADYDNIGLALQQWANDCDTHHDNIAILFVSGHGVVTTSEARWAFAPQAGRLDNIYAYGINVTAIKQGMAFRRARTQVFIWDLCALLHDAPDNPGNPGASVTIPKRDKSAEHAGAENQVTIMSRLGTRAVSQNVKYGTVLCRALVGRDAEDFKQRLMYRAVDVDEHKHFAITPQRVNELLPDAVAAVMSGDPGEMKAIVEATKVPVGLNEPYPMPEFTVELVWKDIAIAEILHITVTDTSGKVIETYDMDPSTGESEISACLRPLPAGRYRIKWETSSGDSDDYRIPISKDVRVDVLSGWEL